MKVVTTEINKNLDNIENELFHLIVKEKKFIERFNKVMDDSNLRTYKLFYIFSPMLKDNINR